MMSKHSLFLITSRQSFIAEAERVVGGAGAATSVRIGGSMAFNNGATAPAGLEALRSGAATAVLVDLDSDFAEAFKTLEDLTRTSPESRVLVASTNRDPDLILRAVRAGAADFLALPLDRVALGEALVRNLRRGGAESAAPRGRVMSFLSAKGGCGATSVAVNLAATLAGSSKSGRSVVLVDLDSPGGDAAAMLKLKPVYSLADVAANIHRLDMDLLNSMMLRHESGLNCLAAAGEGATLGRVLPDQMSSIVSFLHEHHDDVVLAGGGLGELEMAAMNLSHMVHVVTTLDFLSLKRAQGIIARLREFGVTGDALRVVVNKIDRGSDLTTRDARQVLDAPVVWSIPHDSKTADRAVNEGVTYAAAGRSRLQAAFDEYATLLAGEAGSAAGVRSMGRLLRRLVPGRAGMPA